METTLASPQGAHRRSSAILPIFAIGRVAEVQSDEKSIFPLKRTAHFRQRIITSNLRDRYTAVRNARVTIDGAFSTRSASPSRCP
jgi:hypothetical protein